MQAAKGDFQVTKGEELESFGARLGRLINERLGQREETLQALILEAYPPANDIDDIIQYAKNKAKTIRALISGETKKPTPKIYLPICNVLGITNDEIKVLRCATKIRRSPAPESFQPQLEDRRSGKRAAENILHYQNRLIEQPLGREEAMARLKTVLEGPPGFQWLQIAGVGGQGKSRMAWELILVAQDRGWAAGQLPRQSAGVGFEHWSTWQPDRPHLLVVDYVVGRESEIKIIVNALKTRSNLLEHPVRLLFLERQPWDGRPLVTTRLVNDEDRSDQLQIGGLAEWFTELADDDEEGLLGFRTRHYNKNDDALEFLENLKPEHLVEIVQIVARHFGTHLDLPAEKIADQLKQIDKEGRPLYAYFLGKVLTEEPTNLNLNREGLLDSVINRDFIDRWKHAYPDKRPSLDSDLDALTLAVVATMTQGVDAKALADDELIDFPDSNTRTIALVMTDGDTRRSPAHGVTFDIPPLLPDILGEWFVLSSMDLHNLDIHQILVVASTYKPSSFAAFILRITQDFLNHRMTTQVLDFEVTSGPLRKALAEVVVEISRALFDSKHPFPSWVIDVLNVVPNEKQAEAAHIKGLANYYGLCGGVEPNHNKAFEYFRLAYEIDPKYNAAARNIGICYIKGIGVKPDPVEAVAWFRRTADAGDAKAMFSLGASYEYGIGVEVNPVEAIAWYRRAAAAGHAGAMNNLGLCYKDGIGVKPDPEEAIAWYRRAADAGHARAIKVIRSLDDGAP